ncbi:MAG: hypothetical protein PVI66_13970 [Candidatus Aminicenantes bacterium]|jgi:hypothetical protein
MKHSIAQSYIVLSILLVFNSCVQQNDFPKLMGPYLGQKPPGMIPKIFAPGIISTAKEELNSVFSLDGRAFYFARTKEDLNIIYYSEQTNNQWKEPKIVPFSGSGDYVDMSFSPDGNRLYFCSNRQFSTSCGGMDIWYIEQSEKGWTEPKNIGVPVNSPSHDVYPIFTRNRGLYFTSDRKSTKGDWDVYYAQFIGGRYSKPIRLDNMINSEYGEGDTYVAFDESFMIVTSWGRPCSYGNSDLYISYKLKDGSWSKAKNMGESINTEFSEHCPMLSPDGKYLFFTSTRTGNRDIYWVDAKIIDQFKPEEIR